MAIPDKIIQKIQLDPDDANTIHDIVPQMMTDSAGTYKAELPILEDDDTIMVESQMPKVVRLI